MLIISLSLFPKSQLTANYTVFSQVPNGNFYNINVACKAIDVDSGPEVGIKTWKTSANNRTFSISQKPLHSIFLSANTLQLALGKQ